MHFDSTCFKMAINRDYKEIAGKRTAVMGKVFTTLLLLLSGVGSTGCYFWQLDQKANTPSLDINTSPGPEWSDGERARGQGVPTIERAPDGRLWVAFRTEYSLPHLERSIVLVTSDDDGYTWSDPKVVIHENDENGDRVSTFDPALWHDPTGRLWFFWCKRFYPDPAKSDDSDYEDFHIWAIKTDHSEDENPLWSEPRKLMEGVMLNKPVVLSTGDWLFPSTSWRRHTTNWPDETTVFRSTDQGATFSYLGGVHTPDVRFNEHMIVERKDNSLWMLARPNWNDLTGIAESFSYDGGRTWSKGTRQSHYMEGPNTRFFISRLQSGKLLLIYHDHPRLRTNLTAFLSEDDGRTWPHRLLLDDRQTGDDSSDDAISYPDAVESNDGRIYIVYDRNRQTDQEILMTVITEEDIMAGELISAESRTKILVNDNRK